MGFRSGKEKNSSFSCFYNRFALSLSRKITFAMKYRYLFLMFVLSSFVGRVCGHNVEGDSIRNTSVSQLLENDSFPYEKTIKLAAERNDSTLLGIALIARGEYYEEQNKRREAIREYNKAYTLNHETFEFALLRAEKIKQEMIGEQNQALNQLSEEKEAREAEIMAILQATTEAMATYNAMKGNATSSNTQTQSSYVVNNTNTVNNSSTTSNSPATLQTIEEHKKHYNNWESRAEYWIKEFNLNDAWLKQYKNLSYVSDLEVDQHGKSWISCQKELKIILQSLKTHREAVTRYGGSLPMGDTERIVQQCVNKPFP